MGGGAGAGLWALMVGTTKIKARVKMAIKKYWSLNAITSIAILAIKFLNYVVMRGRKRRNMYKKVGGGRWGGWGFLSIERRIFGGRRHSGWQLRKGRTKKRRSNMGGVGPIDKSWLMTDVYMRLFPCYTVQAIFRCDIQGGLGHPDIWNFFKRYY